MSPLALFQLTLSIVRRRLHQQLLLRVYACIVRMSFGRLPVSADNVTLPVTLTFTQAPGKPVAAPLADKIPCIYTAHGKSTLPRATKSSLDQTSNQIQIIHYQLHYWEDPLQARHHRFQRDHHHHHANYLNAAQQPDYFPNQTTTWLSPQSSLNAVILSSSHALDKATPAAAVTSTDTASAIAQRSLTTRNGRAASLAAKASGRLQCLERSRQQTTPQASMYRSIPAVQHSQP